MFDKIRTEEDEMNSFPFNTRICDFLDFSVVQMQRILHLTLVGIAQALIKMIFFITVSINGNGHLYSNAYVNGN